MHLCFNLLSTPLCLLQAEPEAALLHLPPRLPRLGPQACLRPLLPRRLLAGHCAGRTTPFRLRAHCPLLSADGGPHGRGPGRGVRGEGRGPAAAGRLGLDRAVSGGRRQFGESCGLCLGASQYGQVNPEKYRDYPRPSSL
jgi:hypothetical protein